jgi:hypothetical protein
MIYFLTIFSGDFFSLRKKEKPATSINNSAATFQMIYQKSSEKLSISIEKIFTKL